MRYYKCNKKVSLAIRAEYQHWLDIKKKARALSKQVGADTKNFYYGCSMGTLVVSGFIFKEPPDPKLWKASKHHDGVYLPKVKNPIREEFHSLQYPMGDRVCDILKINKNRMVTEGASIFFCSPTIEFQGDVCYITMRSDWKTEPVGARRISDLTYEKATKPKPKKQAKKKSAKSKNSREPKTVASTLH